MLATDDQFLRTALSKTETLKAGRQNYEDELHTAAEIDSQLEKVSSPVIRENAAYYFRYVAKAITPEEKRNAILQAFAKKEDTLSTEGSIIALGRRFVIERKR